MSRRVKSGLDMTCPRPVLCWVAWLVLTSAGCDGLVTPEKDACVPVGPVQVTWKPAKKPMVLQYYQSATCLRSCGPNPPPDWSGAKIAIESPGKTEIKIWEPGAAKPFDSVWVFADRTCP